MITKRIDEKRAQIIQQYKDVPYFNNRRSGLRGALPVEVGKGSPKEIYDEFAVLLRKRGLVEGSVDPKKFLIENNIGIDCSGFVYHILGKTNYAFPYAGGFFRKMIAKFRPVTNIDVKTFAHDKNSKIISLRELEPGDIITIVGNGDASRDHILLVDQIEYQNDIPATIHYVHSIALPEDGQYKHGFHEGKIEIINIDKPITDQVWSENTIRERALQNRCEVRRVMVS